MSCLCQSQRTTFFRQMKVPAVFRIDNLIHGAQNVTQIRSYTTRGALHCERESIVCQYCVITQGENKNIFSETKVYLPIIALDVKVRTQNECASEKAWCQPGATTLLISCGIDFPFLLFSELENIGQEFVSLFSRDKEDRK